MPLTPSDYSRRYRERHPEQRAKAVARTKAWRERNPEWARRLDTDGALKRTYGISLEDYHKMVSERDGRCDICGRKPKRKLVVDHSHETGRIRGLLCQGCNVSIGILRTKEKFLAAIAYLDRYEWIH